MKFISNNSNVYVQKLVSSNKCLKRIYIYCLHVYLSSYRQTPDYILKLLESSTIEANISQPGLLNRFLIQTQMWNLRKSAYEYAYILSKIDLNLWGITVFRTLTAVSSATLLRVTLLQEFTVLAYYGV